MHKILSKVISIFLVLLLCSCTESKKETSKEAKVEKVNYLKESKEDFNNRMAWWRDATFGMFIHWGPYAVPAGTYKGKQIAGNGEWIKHNAKIPISEYEQFSKKFNPQSFNADSWVKTMKDAGMKYVVITSKHHDGFGLWNSKVSNYNIVKYSPYGKDILKSLSAACRKQGIKFGVYYSIIDWHHPDAQADTYDEKKKVDSTDVVRFQKYYTSYMKPQIKELVHNYDVDILWLDGEWIKEFTHDQGQDLYQSIRTLKPEIIINNRVDKGRQGYQGMYKDDGISYAGDFGTPEQEILENISDLDWESCMTMNDTWGFKTFDHNWKTAENLIYNLIDVTAKGGNYLLNVGPTKEGFIPKESVARLKIMGEWLNVNSEAIYKTNKLNHSYKQGEFIRFTKNKQGNIYYAISLKKPEKTILIKNIKPIENSKIKLLGYKKELTWKYKENTGLRIKIPNDIEGKYAWTFKIEGVEIESKK